MAQPMDTIELIARDRGRAYADVVAAIAGMAIDAVTLEGFIGNNKEALTALGNSKEALAILARRVPEIFNLPHDQVSKDCLAITTAFFDRED